jgi:DNA-binding NarL/FixJ family response regulator
MKKILLVDDDKTLRVVIKRFLEKHGYEVEDLGSGTTGLDAFNKNNPDLVISDVAMPGMDGFEFCRQLRSQSQGNLIPFIFLTARTGLDDRIQGHSLGADGYLTKPFEMRELLAKVEGVLERSQRINEEIAKLLEKSSFKRFQTGDGNNDQINPEPLPLTPAEERVFWEVLQGLTNKQISERLYISPRTVQTHLRSILGKFNVNNRTQLVHFAYENGYRPPTNP